MKKKYPITIDKGASFIREITYLDEDDIPIDLSDCHVEMQIRESALATTAILTISDTEGSITLVDDEGKIIINIPPATTAALEAPASAVYDVKLTFLEGEVIRLLEGPVCISPMVTQDQES